MLRAAATEHGEADKAGAAAIDRLRADMVGVYRPDDLNTLRNEWDARRPQAGAEGAGGPGH